LISNARARAQVQNVLLRDTRELYAFRVMRLLGAAAHRVGQRMFSATATAVAAVAVAPATSAGTGTGPSSIASLPLSVSSSVSSSVTSAPVDAVHRMCVAALRAVTRRDPNDVIARGWMDDCARRLPVPTSPPPPSVPAALHDQVDWHAIMLASCCIMPRLFCV
jgi:hypothetical protein